MLRFLPLILALLVVGGCKRKEYEQQQGGQGIMAEALPSMMTDLETRAHDLLMDMADVLQAHADRPTDAVRRIEAFLRVNATEMSENAAALQTRYGAMQGYEARIYEAQLAEYMGRAMAVWLAAERTFSVAHPEEGQTIRALVDAVDTAE
jgi:hypothetical protein